MYYNSHDTISIPYRANTNLEKILSAKKEYCEYIGYLICGKPIFFTAILPPPVMKNFFQ